MSVVRLSERPSIPVWAEFAPRLVQRLVARVREREDARVLGAQLHGAMKTLSDDRYQRMADYFAASEIDGLKLVALVLTASWDAEKPIDMVFAVLTEEEREQVFTYVAELGDLLPDESGQRPLAVEPVGVGLVAASPVKMSQEPGRYRFRVSLAGAVQAEVEVRLGGGPAGLRQISGPPLMLAEQGVPLPVTDVLLVAVDNGADLASWLEEALCQSSDDEG